MRQVMCPALCPSPEGVHFYYSEAQGRSPRSAIYAVSSGMSSLDQPTSGEDGPQSSTATSPSLLRRVKKDDAAAWDRLVGLYAPLVYHWCRGADLPEQEIADVFQDVFQAVATHIADFRRDGANDTFRGWLRVDHPQQGA